MNRFYLVGLVLFFSALAVGYIAQAGRLGRWGRLLSVLAVVIPGGAMIGGTAGAAPCDWEEGGISEPLPAPCPTAKAVNLYRWNGSAWVPFEGNVWNQNQPAVQVVSDGGTPLNIVNDGTTWTGGTMTFDSAATINTNVLNAGLSDQAALMGLSLGGLVAGIRFGQLMFSGRTGEG